jgi:signal transduction histidine kinase
MAQAFAAQAAGIAGPLEGNVVLRHRVDAAGQPLPPGRWPWEEQPELLAQVRDAARAVPTEWQGANWLLTSAYQPSGSSWLVWLETAGERRWHAAEAAALTLASTVLAHQVSGAPDRPRWARQLEQASRQQHLEATAKALGLVTHHFSNVLTSVLGFSDLILTQLTRNSPVYPYVKNVYQAAQKGNQLLQQLRLFCQRTPVPAPSAVLAVVVAQEERRVRQAWPPGVRLRIAMAQDLPSVAIDADALQRVIRHLLDNAHAAVAGDGLITLSARVTQLTEEACRDLLGRATPGPHLEIQVTDTGRGLSPEVQRRLFRELFFSTKPNHLGLGLAAVYGTLVTYRGGFGLEPRPEGGTVVRLFLPLAPAVSPAPVARPCSGMSASPRADGTGRDNDPYPLST